MSRTVCAITGSRAEYGLLYPTLCEINREPDLQLQLVVTGTHLSQDFGLTYQIIESDGIEISAQVDMALDGDSALATGQAMGRAVSGFAEILHRLKPDVLLVLGDRYEILAAAEAALLQRIPIAHIHGGESTEGMVDEAIRHSITKMAHIHCVAAEPYARRVIQMGEQPSTVHVVGATGFDQLDRIELLDQNALEDSIDFKLAKQNFLVTLHPETLTETSAEQQVSPLLDALKYFPEAHVVFTGSNADTAGRQISARLRQYAESRPTHYCYHESLGQQRYISLLHKVDLVIGNSSSGIIEAPAVGKPVVNIGERQCGRLRAPAIIDCKSETEAIQLAIKNALSTEHRKLAACKTTPYGTPGAAKRIVNILKNTPLRGILHKHFYEMPTGSAS